MKRLIVVAFAVSVSTANFYAQTSGSTPGSKPSSAGPLADSCGVPASVPASAEGGRGGGQPIFPPGQFPVRLPPKSLLGAPNDLPNPYQAGEHWGQLPAGRKWGST